MGQDASTTNEPVKIVDTVLKEALDLGTIALETALNAYVPFTALPVVKQLIDFVLGRIETIFYEAIATDTTFLILKFETFIEKTGYMSAVSDLKAAQLEGDPLKLQAAQKAFADAASSLIHDDGSYTP